MPPSGYSVDQVRLLGSFLRSCSEALDLEGRARGESPIEALEREIHSISRALPRMQAPFVAPVLEFTRDFYRALVEERPRDYAALSDAVLKRLDSVDRAVLGIHVPSIEGLSSAGVASHEQVATVPD